MKLENMQEWCKRDDCEEEDNIILLFISYCLLCCIQLFLITFIFHQKEISETYSATTILVLNIFNITIFNHSLKEEKNNQFRYIKELFMSPSYYLALTLKFLIKALVHSILFIFGK